MRICPHELDRIVEGRKVPLWDNRDARSAQFLLAEGAIVFEPITVGGAADDQLAGLTNSVRLGALAEDIVEHHDVGPVDIALPVVGFRHEAISNLPFLLVADEVPNVMAFFG